MSAIWGALYLDSKELNHTVLQAMNNSMAKYKINRIDSVTSSKIFFACGHQYLTPEAEKETLPFFDKVRDTYFTADCIIDNRNELMQELNIQDSSTPDGTICYLAYVKWGEYFVKHLLGIFSFAIYNARDNVFLLYTDHLGNRCINYYLKDNVLYFATTYDPIKKALEPELLPLSEKWIVACEAEPSACMIYYPGLTPYTGLYQLEASHFIKVSNGKIHKKQYWNPLNTKHKRFKCDDDYKQLFIDTYTKCIDDLLRPGVKVAATLSSGLDSSSIACIAASILKERDQKIYTYTSIPEQNFTYSDDDYYIADESSAVKKTAEQYTNMECEFVQCHGKSPLTKIEKLVSEYGFPLKSSVNLLWLDEVNKLANEKGCSIILSGQYGNSTISYGNIFTLAYQQTMSFHILKSIRAVKIFLNKNNIPKKNFTRILKAELKNKVREIFRLNTMDLYVETYVKKDLFKNHHIQKTFNAMGRCGGTGCLQSKKQHHHNLLLMQEMQQLSMYNTQSSLINGVIERDPTRDKRIIELCMSYPISCFVANGTDRRMVREYLKDWVPPHITNDMKHRGLQGADLVTRMNNTWTMNKDMVLGTLENKKLLDYLDQEKLHEMIEQCKTTVTFSEEDYSFLIYLLYFISLSYFIS